MRAVLDTNVLISSVISTGVPHEIVVKGFSSEYQIIVSVATLTEFRAADGVGRVTMRVPNTADIRRLAEQFESTFSRAELRAKRQLDSTVDTPEGFRQQLEETLTDRQHETLQAAYHAGFFAWPRANTGETIADRLGITGPTFLQHLRAGERKLLEVLFEQDQTVYSE
jgi:predicted DNA binding protein